MVFEWPDKLCPSSMDWTINYNNRAFTSTLSNSQQVVSYPGAYWSVSIQFDSMVRRKAIDRELSALVGRMKGMLNPVKVPRFTRRKMSDIGTITLNVPAENGTSTVQATGFSGGSLVIGDMITINDQLFEVVEEPQVAAGVANLILNKQVRGGIPAGTVIEYMNPYCVMRFNDDEFMMQERPIRSSGSLSLREAF